MNKKFILYPLLLVPTMIFGMKKLIGDLSAPERHQINQLARQYHDKVREFKKFRQWDGDPDILAAETFEYYKLELLLQSRELTTHQHEVILEALYCGTKR